MDGNGWATFYVLATALPSAWAGSYLDHTLHTQGLPRSGAGDDGRMTEASQHLLCPRHGPRGPGLPVRASAGLAPGRGWPC